MTIKFSSKEIHFLKTDSDDFTITPPETYLSDLLLEKTTPITVVETKLAQAKKTGKKFLCAVLEMTSTTSDAVLEKGADVFEATFNAFWDPQKGLWEPLSQTSFVLVFWDQGNGKKASHRLVSFKEKLSVALKTTVLMGAAIFPHHDFSEPQTIANAVKAFDHAAFFGPDTLIYFDATSLNISADRLYQQGQYDRAIAEYKKGLDLAPTDINLINSLGVCFGVMDNLDQAKLEFKRALAITPNEVLVVYNMGLLYQINGEMNKAIQQLRNAHDIDDAIFEVELLLGHLLFKNGQPDPAMPHLETASRINPKSGSAFRMKGEIYLAKNLPEKAGHEFNTAIKLNPGDAISLSGYAVAMAHQDKNLGIAVSFAKNSIALQPDNHLFKERLKAILEKIEGHTPLPEETIKSA
ncbi:tetratricopeptide repeat protein [Desulfobacula sp.]|uniref:tetratricopeptide repeat protein n=1 Tax=Desulfobacula sp. TaxID=2593537 RepID=UPI0026302E82|nr:tetratricopeptide repeat protein [Desulfobacula sp.]